MEEYCHVMDTSLRREEVEGVKEGGIQLCMVEVEHMESSERMEGLGY